MFGEFQAYQLVVGGLNNVQYDCCNVKNRDSFVFVTKALRRKATQLEKVFRLNVIFSFSTLRQCKQIASGSA